AVMLVAASLSAFISSTGTVAVLIPVVMALARTREVAPSRLLMPLAYGSLFGGMLTLIGTPPNLIVSATRTQLGAGPFGFFDYTVPGLVMLTIGVMFIGLVGHRLLPDRGASSRAGEGPGDAQLAEEYGLLPNLSRLRVPRESSLAGLSLVDSALHSRFGVTVLAIRSRTRRGPQIRQAQSASVIRAGDELIAAGRDSEMKSACDEFSLTQAAERPSFPDSVRLIEAVVPPRSRFSGKTLRELRLHSGAGVTVMAHRPIRETALTPPDLERPLEVGDALLLTGRIPSLQRLAENARDLVLLGGDLGLRNRRTEKAPLALVIMLLMLVAITLNWLPNVIAVLIAASAMLFARCLTVEEAFGGINWESVLLIAAVLPMATALESAGGMELAARALFDLAESYGPHVLLLAVFVVTSGLSQMVSNTATTVLAAPIALNAAAAMGVSADPVLITVAIAASTAFATPIASPANTLIYNPGGYRFADYARVGLPLQALVMVATVLVVPWVFPF
ncbi:MAG: SLC13 family permease, partial [Wenzhouxiangellaceae bacterium]